MIRTLMAIAIVGFMSSCDNEAETAKKEEVKEVVKEVVQEPEAPAKMTPPEFRDIDADADGVIVEQECKDFRAMRMKKMEDNGQLEKMKEKMGNVEPPAFSEIDADGDGGVTPEEFEAFHKKHHEEMKSKMDGSEGEMKCGEGKCGEGKCGGK